MKFEYPHLGRRRWQLQSCWVRIRECFSGAADTRHNLTAPSAIASGTISRSHLVMSFHVKCLKVNGGPCSLKKSPPKLTCAAGFQQKMPSSSRAICNFSGAAVFWQWRYLLPKFAA